MEQLVPDRVLRIVNNTGRLPGRRIRELQCHVKVGLTEEVRPWNIRRFNRVDVELKIPDRGETAHCSFVSS
jgi:hypothetical protein